MNEHSPTPWEIAYEITGENAWDANGSAYFDIKDANGKSLFTIDRDEEGIAKHIVHCVNLHDELVSLIKHLRYETKYSRNDFEWMNELLAKADAQ